MRIYLARFPDLTSKSKCFGEPDWDKPGLAENPRDLAAKLSAHHWAAALLFNIGAVHMLSQPFFWGVSSLMEFEQNPIGPHRSSPLSDFICICLDPFPMWIQVTNTFWKDQKGVHWTG